MTDQDQEQFEARAWKEFEEETERLKQVTEAMQAENYEGDPNEIEEYRDPLCFMKKIEINIQLSWGGPGDGFKILFDAEGEPESGVYYWQDWFKYKEFDLSEEELQMVCDLYHLDSETIKYIQ